MADNISSNVLFHFTRSLDVLKSILEHGFFPRYCPEYTLDKEDRIAARMGEPPTKAIPMVCFCDLPISLIGKHLQEYGSFGIGLEKSWGIAHKLAPVIYTHDKARTRPPVSRITAQLSKPMDRLSSDILYLAAHSKPFRGPAWRKNKVQEMVQFYDEREWRYVPAVSKAEELFLSRKEYRNKRRRMELHKHLEARYALTIPPRAIQYLIMPYKKHERNVLELHDYIMNLYDKSYNRQEAALVATAIMTTDCINDDI